MDVCDEKVADVDGFPAACDQSKRNRGQRACVSTFPTDTCAIAGVFNASDNLGKLHRLENRPKSRHFLVDLGWSSNNVTVLPCSLENSVAREAHGRERFHEDDFSVPLHDDQNVPGCFWKTSHIFFMKKNSYFEVDSHPTLRSCIFYYTRWCSQRCTSKKQLVN